jgi:hypothetical protein
MAAMSYDLAVWEGDRPPDDQAGSAVYLEHLKLLEDADPADPIPPTPRIRAYVEALLDRWPDIDEHDESPWASSPLMSEGIGSFIYLTMVYSMAEETSAFAADLARQHGLVCYDPQLDRLRPEPGDRPGPAGRA